jgi:hydrogenase maturation protease
VKEALLALEFAGRAPHEVVVVGAVPARTDLGLELSPAMMAAVPAAVDAIAGVLDRWGVRVLRRFKPITCWSLSSPAGAR